MFRLLSSLLFLFGPQLLPRVVSVVPRAVRFVRAIYRMHFDPRVNPLLKLLIPLAVLYGFMPWDLIKDNLPYGLGRYDDFIVLALAVWLFWLLSPLYVEREYMGDPPPPRPEDLNPDEVVDGHSRPADGSDDAD